MPSSNNHVYNQELNKNGSKSACIFIPRVYSSRLLVNMKTVGHCEGEFKAGWVEYEEGNESLPILSWFFFLRFSDLLISKRCYQVRWYRKDFHGLALQSKPGAVNVGCMQHLSGATKNTQWIHARVTSLYYLNTLFFPNHLSGSDFPLNTLGTAWDLWYQFYSHRQRLQHRCQPTPEQVNTVSI